MPLAATATCATRSQVAGLIQVVVPSQVVARWMGDGSGITS